MPPTICARSHAPSIRLLAIVCGLILTLVLVVGADSAEAKKKKRRDKRSPYVTAATTLDSDGDGRVDAALLTYSEPVKIAKVRKGNGKPKKKNRKKKPWRVMNRALGRIAIKPGSRRRQVLVRFSPGSAVDTAEKPTIVYRRVPKGAKGVVDRAGNQALTATVKTKDAVAPRLSAARTADTDTDGRIDAVILTYGEPVADPRAGQYVVSGYSVTGASADGETVTLTLAETGVETDAVLPVAAIGGAVDDGAGNAQQGDQSVVAADGAPPAVVDAVTADTNANGRIDQIVVKFSERITHSAESGAGAIGSPGFQTARVSEALFDELVLEISDLGGGSNTGVKPAIVASATASPVADLAGNVLAGSSFTATRDGAPPALTAARTRDADGDGRIDAILATFSEPVIFTAGVFPFFSSTTVELGAFAATATVNGAVVTAAVNEVAAPATNSDLPRTSPSLPLPIAYTQPVSGGVADAAGNRTADKVVSAADGAGPAITYAETADDNGDGRIDGMRIGFSEPIDELLGNPFEIADGVRTVVDVAGVSSDGSALITSGSPGDPLYRGVYVPLYALTTDGTTNGPLADPDGADRPTVDYVPHTGGGTRAKFAEDAANNEVIATGSQAFTAALDKIRPILLSLEAQDADVDGFVDRLRSVWSEPVATDGTPDFAGLVAQNAPPSGYAAPVVQAGATASGFAVDVPLVESASPDRDMRFSSQYVSGGPSDGGVRDVAVPPNNAATSPTSPVESSALCSDSSERLGSGQDDVAGFANATGLAAAGTEYLGTLCGSDSDFYSFSVVAPQTVKVVLAPSSGALAIRAPAGAYNPFTAEGPSGAISVTSAFDPDVGWTGEFVAALAGSYKIGVRDNVSPLLDYGYCISRTDDGSTPSCAVSQGDLVITEVLRDIQPNPPTVGPYVELRNVSGIPVTIAGDLTLRIQNQICTITPQNGTNATIPDGGYFYVSQTADNTETNDFYCLEGMASIDYASPISVENDGGVIDSVEFGSISVPPATTVQLRSQPQWQNSSANDDIARAWCLSTAVYGTWGTANNNCDQFRINEVGFLPANSATRDGKVFVELKGSGSVTPTSTLLAGWRIRVRPQGGPGEIIMQLPATANPSSQGLFVLADSPATGDTQVPLYSVQSSAVSSSSSTFSRDLEQYLRADLPVTVQLLAPTGGDPYTCTAPAIDVLGFVPTSSGTLTAGSDACGPYKLGNEFKAVDGYSSGVPGTPDDSVQRSNELTFTGNNLFDYCNRAASPLSENEICSIIS
ncbi:MAG: hypothetical protein WAO61_07090 [Solirubrobacterales bacterium]